MKIKIIKYNGSFLLWALFFLIIQGCNQNRFEYDASGVFEANEVIVSAEMAGKLI